MVDSEMDTSAVEVSTADITPRKYTSSVFCSKDILPVEFVKGIKALEAALGMPVFMLVQNGAGKINELSSLVYQKIFEARHEFKQGPIALLIESPGGEPRVAYKLAKLFLEQSGDFIALVPQYAKSAATLLAMGAEKIVLGRFAELGPLDMQVTDHDGEEITSALNHVQSLERLRAFALETLDEVMFLLVNRTGKKMGTILPYASSFSADIARPILEKIDVVRYTEMSRWLKVGEAYAKRLLKRHYDKKDAEQIAASLVSNYPEHGFVIDHSEAKDLGLKIELPEGDVEKCYTDILMHVNNITAIGLLKELNTGETK